MLLPQWDASAVSRQGCKKGSFFVCCRVLVYLQVDLPALLLDLHGYFSTLGASEVRRLSNNNDKPLRMVKTMLHTLCKIYGYKVADVISSLNLRDSQTGQQPMIAMYADINLKSLAEIGMIVPRDAADDGVAGPPTPSGSATHAANPAAPAAPSGTSPTRVTDPAAPQAPPLHNAAAVNGSMPAEPSAPGLSSHALGLATTASDGQHALPTQPPGQHAARSHLSESGSAAPESLNRSASTTGAAIAGAPAINGTASAMSGVSGGISAPSGGISAHSSIAGTAVDTVGSGSGSLASSTGLAQPNNGMSGGVHSGQLSARSTQSDTHRSGGEDSDDEEDDPGSHPDHFLSRIARRVESGGGEQPQPLKSSQTVNTSPGRHNAIGPTMPEDLREKVTPLPPCLPNPLRRRACNESQQQQQSRVVVYRSSTNYCTTANSVLDILPHQLHLSSFRPNKDAQVVHCLEFSRYARSLAVRHIAVQQV